MTGYGYGSGKKKVTKAKKKKPMVANRPMPKKPTRNA
jgi:hypothetical protein